MDIKDFFAVICQEPPTKEERIMLDIMAECPEFRVEAILASLLLTLCTILQIALPTRWLKPPSVRCFLIAFSFCYLNCA